MHKFLFKIFLYIIFGFIVCLSICVIYTKQIKHQQDTECHIYIWGDSQIYQGIDISRLSALKNESILSSAEHGAGVYDLAVFADMVPDSSICIVGFSEACLYRKTSRDNNRSGMNIVALESLFKSGYKINDLYQICFNNQFLPKQILSTRCGLYEYSDTISLPESVEGWCKMFAVENECHLHKKTAYLMSLETLSNKGCGIIMVSFPLYSLLYECTSTSINRKHTNKFKSKIIQQFNADEYTIILKNDSLLMHDLSHLNEVGSRRVTSELAKLPIFDGKNHFVNITINY